MTRRIALAILLTTWAVLIAGCMVAYFTVRWAMIRQLDFSMERRAASIPELAAVNAAPNPSALSPSTDRYIIRTDNGQAKLSPAGGGRAVSDVVPVSGTFTKMGDGTRWRVLTLRASARLDPGGDPPIPVTISYFSSAEQLDRLLNRLAVTFSVFGVCAGIITALVALRASRTALRPLHDTADVIGTIEPKNLDRRIDQAKLPPELVPMASRLNEMLERIERAYAQRQQFLADASHELRTPVAALVTTAEVALRHPRDAEAYRRTLETCLADARLLRRLVERLMEQCRADTLSHDEPAVEIDLAPLLDECADQAASLGQSKNITLLRSIPPSIRWQTQPGRLRSVVTNLLANAVEHNRPGGTVEMAVVPNGQWLGVSIKDTGPGIAAEHLPYLFEPFFRIDRSRSHEEGHMGLGLALVQAHLRALGGRIRVESRPGEGTVFHVELPRKDTAENDAPPGR
jgi:signal transduction histidine kinase